MPATALATPRFVRRTRLGPDEYRRNFHQIDHDVVAAVASEEADSVTPLMSKIYLRLVSAPPEFWEREGVLYFSAGDRDGRPVKASKVLYELLGVASATAHKALGWMHEQGIIGYFAGKNGAGIRIFLNRAAGSIGVRAPTAGKKILPFGRGSNGELAGSTAEPAFNDSYADLEVQETDLNPGAPKSGAGQTKAVGKAPDPQTTVPRQFSRGGETDEGPPLRTPLRVEVPVDEIVVRLSRELKPTLEAAASSAAIREHERTREWLENRGLPKAARVAQREAYNVLRRHGLGILDRDAGDSSLPAEQGAARPLTVDEIRELAESCVAVLEAQGRAIDETLEGLTGDDYGMLRLEDAAKVRELAMALAQGGK